jgi:hypothetical protein
MLGEFIAKDKVGYLNTLKAYGEVEIQTNRLLNSVPDGDKWSSMYPDYRIILETLKVSRCKTEFHIMGSEP